MKSKWLRFILFSSACITIGPLWSQVAINSTASLPATSAMLDVSSTTRGFLAPRMTSTQRNAISSPAEGLLVYQTDGSKGLYYYTGSAWTYVTSSTNVNWALAGNSGIVSGTNFLGTTDNVSMRFRTNNVQRLWLDSLGSVGVGTSPAFTAGTFREKFLVDAGTTTSYNVISGKGSINNYLQLNIQNTSNGTTASSDVVATADNGNESTNYVDLGINSSGNTSAYFGGANDAYLFNVGQNLLVGTATTGKNISFLTGGGTQSTNERMRIDGDGNVGIGVTDAANNLVVKDTIEVRRVGSGVATLLFSNTAGTGDFRVGGDGGDIYWQGGGGRSLQMGSYWTTILGGDRLTATLPAFANGTSGTGVLALAQRDGSVPFAVQANSATQAANLMEWRNASGTALDIVDASGNMGIGTTTPSSKLHVNSTNPLTLGGLQPGTSADSILTVSNGVVKRLAPSALVTSSSNAWGLAGNSGTTSGTNFIGTTDNKSLRVRTNNAQRFMVDSLGNVGIGTSPNFTDSAREKLLIDAGTTSSFNLFTARGSINNYLQMNVKNQSTGNTASTDVIATADNGNEGTNYIDMGINGSGNTTTGTLGGANTAYLYSTGGDLLIGNGTASKNMTFYSTNASGNTTEKMRLNSLGVTQSQPIKTVTSSYTFTIDDYTILVNNTSAVTINLPPAASVAGRCFSIKKISGSNGGRNVTLNPDGSELIDNGITVSMNTVNTGYIVQSDGTAWWIINR